MNKLDIILQNVGLQMTSDLKEAKIEKVMLNQSSLSYKIFIRNSQPLSTERVKEIDEAFLKYDKNYFLHLIFDDLSDVEVFNKYWNELFILTFIGKQLHDINAVAKFDNKNITINFNLKTQMKSYLDWKETIAMELKRLGYDFPIVFELKENVEEFKHKIKLQTQKLLEDQINNAKLIRMESTQSYINNQSSNESYKNYNNKSIGIKISDIDSAEIKKVTLNAQVTAIDQRKIRQKDLFIYKIGLFDKTKSINAKYFFKTTSNTVDKILSIKVGNWVKVNGRVEYDSFDKELVIILNNIVKITKPQDRKDNANQKRVELSAHTRMSAFDGLSSAKEMTEQAALFGHKAIAFCDVDNVQAFPEIMMADKEVKKNHPAFKTIYGSTINVINSSLDLIVNPTNQLIEEVEFVIFDLETTGLSSHYDQIIEFGAQKIKNGTLIDKLHFFVKSSKPISKYIQNLTGIRQSDVDGGIDQGEAANRIFKFINKSTLVAHNANFDIGFLKKLYLKHHKGLLENPWIDTLMLSWAISKPKRSYRLEKIAKEYGVFYDWEVAHRADYDADILKSIFLKMLESLKINYKVKMLIDIKNTQSNEALVKQFGFSCNIYAKNQTGLKELYEIISIAHTNYLAHNKSVAIPKEELKKYKNIIIASSAHNSEIMEFALNKNNFELTEKIKFYDFILLAPPSDYQYLIERESVESQDILHDVINRIIKEAKRLNKLVVATSDPFYIDPEEIENWKILINTKRLGGSPHPLKDYKGRIQNFPNKHFKTTDELTSDFEFIGREIAQRLVVRNSNIVYDMFDNNIKPLKEGLFVPKIKDSQEKLKELCYQNAYEKYGKPLPDPIVKRLEKELEPICSQNFDTVYYVSHLIVKKSLEDGYLVGSRGSVGSSLVATLSKITEVNPLPPHYICKCKYSDFNVDLEKYGSGFDLPPINCPKCNEVMYGDGHDIPFETFMGFNGDKIPDIDLNFSNIYQSQAHDYTKELFGPENVFRAGTISTVQSKTAYGYVMNYQEENNIESSSKATIDRLVAKLVGTKRTTGQHPGGIMVLPKEYDITDFTPINYPANEKAEWITTHFDYHSIHNNLLKLDLLGHVDPTAIRMLQDITGVDPIDIPFYDDNVIGIFSGLGPLKLKSKMPISEFTGGIGIPEFGTNFVRQMLAETKPKSFNELIILSGLSHGTGVYRGNSRNLIINGKKMSDVIGCRDDIMLFMIKQGLSKQDAFDIMEFIRKGHIEHKPLEWEIHVQKMKEHGVEQWYIDSCSKINYLFPKAHATAYVMMAWRVAWFKVYYPLEYYATLFSLRCDAFEINTILKGDSFVLERYNEIKQQYSKNKSSVSVKEIDLLKTLEMVIEMFARGYQFQGIDINKSTAENFTIDKSTNQIIIPFVVINGLGPNVANSIVEAREQKAFSSQKDLMERTKLNSTVFELLKSQGVLSSLPSNEQISLFDF